MVVLRLLLNLNHYSVYVDDVNLGKIKANLSGKINFSVELSERPQDIKIEKHL